jgi:3-oxoacyl-[acyl-carrier-protein] synthase II
VFERAERGGGMAIGSLGAFLVLESSDHAVARGARPLARLSRVECDRTRRQPGETTAALERLWAPLERSLDPGHSAILSGATGAEPATAAERAFLARHADVPVRATGTHIGHGIEAQFPMNIALASLALMHGTLYPAADASGLEKAMDGHLRQVIVTGVGHWRGEGMALVEAAS